MGLWISKGIQMKILMLGLDNAGKTTILYKMKVNETVCTMPTIGFNIETVYPMKGVTFTVWDVGGQDRIRPLWRNYCTNCDGLLYVVDSTDIERLEEAREELFNMLENDNFRGIPVVILANKQDVFGAMTASEVTKHLYMNSLTGRDWCVQQTCATTGEGVYKAMRHIATLAKEFKKSKQ